MSRSFSQTLNRSRYFLASLLILGVQLLPFGSLWQNTASAADTGFKIPTSTHAPNGWDINTVANIQASDNQYVTEIGDSEQGYSNFNFNIPASSVVSGIEVQTEANSTDDSGCRLGVTLSWNNGSNYTAYKYSDLTNIDSTAVLGGANDTWGRQWTNSELSNANFVVKIQDNDPGSNCNNNAKTSVDLLQIRIHYSELVANPALTQACGLDIALVLDRSTSISSSEMTQMKKALNAFVDALDETPTQFSVSRFATTASVAQGFTSNSSLVTSAINNTTTNGGYTNWEDGLAKAKSTFDPRPSIPNLILFATDGDPTTSGNGSSTDTGQPNAHLAPAIAEANAIKASGSRIVTIGIGLGGSDSTNRLKQISGPVDSGPIQTKDVIITDSFTTLAKDLADWAEATCGGTITATKLVDHDNDENTAPIKASGWNFDIAGQSKSTDTNGQTAAVDVDPGSYSVKETVKDGYAIVNASCKTSKGVSVGTFNKDNASVDGIAVTAKDIVSCEFVNRPTTGTLVVNKVVNGGPSAGKPQDFSFKINDGNATAFESDGSNTTTLSENTQYSVTETNIPTNYTATYTGDCSGTIVASQTKTCTITNTYVAPPELTVTKYAINDNGGTILAKDFSLFVNGAKLTSPTSTTGQAPGQSTATYKETLVANTDYTITETTITGYQNTYITCYDTTNGLADAPIIQQPFKAQGNKKYLCNVGNDDIAPKVTVTKVVNNSWGGTLTGGDFSLYVNQTSVVSGQQTTFSAGNATVSETPVAGYTQESIDCGEAGKTGTFLMVLGGIYNCTITNNDQPGKLIVKKTVINDNGGTKAAEDFSFNVSGKQNTYTFNKNGINEIIVANGTYTVTEVNNPGYQTAYSNCSNLKIPNGVTVTCEITNNDIAPEIEIHKTVLSDNESDSESVFDFSATGPNEYGKEFTLGHGDSKKLENINVGEYTINESEVVGWYADKDTDCYVRDSEGWASLASTTINAELGKQYRCEFVNKKYGSISGHKFNDLNKDGEWDKETEPAIKNWSIILTKEGGCRVDIERLSVQDLLFTEGEDCELSTQMSTIVSTDDNGKYIFDSLEPGQYNVCEIQQEGWTQTAPAEVCYELEVGQGVNLTDIDFGNHKQKVPDEGGVVLGSNSTTKPALVNKLTNTGGNSVSILILAFTLIGLTGFTAYLIKQEQA